MDANTLYYTFSTMAQVLAAILAVSVVFVFAKSGEYRAKMQREMTDVKRLYQTLLNYAVPEINAFHRNIEEAANHGIMVQMKDVFVGTLNNLEKFLPKASLEPHARAQITNLAKEYSANGQANYEYNALLFKQYASLIVFGLVLILLDLFGLALTPWLYHRCPAQYLALWSVLLLTSVFFLLLARFIFSTTKEKSRYTENK